MNAIVMGLLIQSWCVGFLDWNQGIKVDPNNARNSIEMQLQVNGETSGDFEDIAYEFEHCLENVDTREIFNVERLIDNSTIQELP